MKIQDKKAPRPEGGQASSIRQGAVRVSRNENTNDWDWSTGHGFGSADSEAEAYYSAGVCDCQAEIERELAGLLGRFPQ